MMHRNSMWAQCLVGLIVLLAAGSTATSPAQATTNPLTQPLQSEWTDADLARQFSLQQKYLAHRMVASPISGLSQIGLSQNGIIYLRLGGGMGYMGWIDNGVALLDPSSRLTTHILDMPADIILIVCG